MSAETTQTNVQERERSAAQAARDRALSALGQVEQGQRDSMEELRVCLCSYVGALRRDGVSREQTIDAVRSLIAAPVTPEGAFALTPIVREALAELTLQWCAAEYDRLAGDATA
jgi:hypothetical protein